MKKLNFTERRLNILKKYYNRGYPISRFDYKWYNDEDHIEFIIPSPSGTWMMNTSEYSLKYIFNNLLKQFNKNEGFIDDYCNYKNVNRGTDKQVIHYFEHGEFLKKNKSKGVVNG